MSNTRLAISIVDKVIILCTIGIIALAVREQSVPDVPTNVTVGALGELLVPNGETVSE